MSQNLSSAAVVIGALRIKWNAQSIVNLDQTAPLEWPELGLYCLLSLLAEMPTIPIFVESYRFSRPIAELRFQTSKLLQIMILKWYQIKKGGLLLPLHRLYMYLITISKLNTDYNFALKEFATDILFV